MTKTETITGFGLILFGFLLGLIAGIVLISWVTEEEPEANWAVEATLSIEGYNDQVAILDHNLTAQDCIREVRNQRSKWGTNVSFICVQQSR